MSQFAPLLVVLTMWFLILAISRRFLASLGVPVGWVSVRGMIRLIARMASHLARGVFRVIAGTVWLIRRERRAMPPPSYSTIRLPQSARQDRLDL